MRGWRRHHWLLAVPLAAIAASCDSALKPDPPGADPSLISATYVCGNDFDILSRAPADLTVQFQVGGTTEQGELLLPARANDSTPGTTRLSTVQAGSLRISTQDEAAGPIPNAGTPCPPAGGSEPKASQGEWSVTFAWPVVAVHLHLLPGGDVLSWGKIGDPQLWRPSTGTFTPAVSSTMVFCSGHSFLADGRLLVTGGHLDDRRGLPDANIYDPLSQTWTAVAPMRRGRWYPTSTTLANGEVLTLAGTDETGAEVDIPEVWTGSEWRALTGAGRELPYYPRTFVAPNGLVFYAGELRQAAYLDPTGTGRWILSASSHYGRRDYGSAVMYRPGRVLILGGSDPPDGAPTNTAEVIDLTAPGPVWRYTGSMTYPRRQFNTTLLPDGRVLATGGTSAAGFSDPSGAVHAAEMWDPATGQWTLLAGNQVSRVYHSTTLLLPDGRVLHTGSGDGPGLPRELNAEIFSPPYLFRGPRPEINSAPGSVSYGQEFLLGTPDAPRIVRVTLARLGSVTHGFDQNQRFLELSFRRSAGGLTVTAPAGGNLAPPGDYLLFVLDARGVPSVGATLRIGFGAMPSERGQ